MLISSALVWAAVLGAEGGFDVNWLGTNTTETRFGLPLTVSAGNGSYWCIKSRQADPDLIILGHLKIYSPTPGSNTCPMSSLHATKTCPRVCPPSFAHPPLLSIRSICICCFIYYLYFFTINSTYPRLHCSSLLSPWPHLYKNLSDFLFEERGLKRQVAPLWLFLACQIWKTLIRVLVPAIKDKAG